MSEQDRGDAEQTLQAIFALIADWMPPGSDLVDRDVIIAITALLEERHGFKFVEEGVIGKTPHRFSL